MLTAEEINIVRESITDIPDFPKPGIIFRDITSLIENTSAFMLVLDDIAARYANRGITKIAAPEARGFIFGAAVAAKLGVGLVLLRKPGKLPRKAISESYKLEYGENRIECHESSVNPGDKVLLIDDLIATGGTAVASANLIRRLGGTIKDAAFVINLKDLPGVANMESIGVKCSSIVEFEGE